MVQGLLEHFVPLVVPAVIDELYDGVDVEPLRPVPVELKVREGGHETRESRPPVLVVEPHKHNGLAPRERAKENRHTNENTVARGRCEGNAHEEDTEAIEHIHKACITPADVYLADFTLSVVCIELEARVLQDGQHSEALKVVITWLCHVDAHVMEPACEHSNRRACHLHLHLLPPNPRPCQASKTRIGAFAVNEGDEGVSQTSLASVLAVDLDAGHLTKLLHLILDLRFLQLELPFPLSPACQALDLEVGHFDAELSLEEVVFNPPNECVRELDDEHHRDEARIEAERRQDAKRHHTEDKGDGKADKCDPDVQRGDRVLLVHVDELALEVFESVFE